MSQVKIKDYSNWTPCYECDGKGKLPNKVCPTCKGSGKYKNDRFLLTAKTPEGQVIGFEVDQAGK